MRQLVTIAAALSLSAALTSSCSESTFSSSNAKKAEDPQSGTPTTVPPGTPTDTPPSTDCVNGDKVNFAWSGEVKECIIDQGKTYNFDSSTCTEMRQAEFECTWDNLVEAMGEMGLAPTDKIQKDRAEGAKLVTCGQAKDKSRIVVQWLRPPEGGFNCADNNGSRGLITTGCYTVYKDGEQPPKATTDEERKKQVYDCMNSL